MSKIAPDVRIRSLVERLEAGETPPDMLNELRSIARQVEFLEGCLSRHVRDFLDPLTKPGCDGKSGE